MFIKKTAAAATSAVVAGSGTAGVERVLVLYRDVAPDPNELLQLVEAAIGTGFADVPVTSSHVLEPTGSMAYAVVAKFESDGTVSADALARTSTRPFETVKGPVIVAVVWRIAPGDVLQRSSGSSPEVQSNTSIRPEQRTCPLCGSSRVLSQQGASRAELRLDERRSVALDFTVTLINCAACGALINDDVNGDVAVAYKRLMAQSGMAPPRISATLHDAMRRAGLLPALSRSEQQRDYDEVRQVWGCLGMRYVSASELQDALSRIIGGFFAEGVTRAQVRTLEQHTVQLSFLTAGGFCPVRLSRAADGGFSIYGVVSMYRFLADQNPTPGTPQEGTAEHTSGGDELETVTRSPQLAEAEVLCRAAAEAGDPRAMHRLAVILTGRDHLFAAELWYRRAAAEGIADAMYDLAGILAGRGEFVAAESWYRKAADAGNTDAVAALAASLHNRAGRPPSGHRQTRDDGPPPPPAGAYRPPPGEGPPQRYVEWAYIVTFLGVILCSPISIGAGAAALVFSSQVLPKWRAGDFEGAAAASRKTKIWATAASIPYLIAVVGAVIYLVATAATGGN